MKKRVFAMALAAAMTLALAACGPKGGDSSSAQGSVSGSGSEVSTIAPGDGSASTPDTSEPDASSGDVSQPDASTGDVSQPDSSKEPDDNAVVASLSLNRSDFTLFKAGATFQLKAQSQPAGGTFTWTSGDENVATVSDKGLVTAVAAGQTTVTVTDSETGLSTQCIVRVRLEEQEPEEEQQPDESQEPQGIDLRAFYDTVAATYELPFMRELDATGIADLFPGLSDLDPVEVVIYTCSMRPAGTGDIALVQVKDSADVDAVKAIFQARIDRMTGADGQGNPGAWYPGPTKMWMEESRIVSHGNYVLLAVDDTCDQIVADFNALF